MCFDATRGTVLPSAVSEDHGTQPATLFQLFVRYQRHLAAIRDGLDGAQNLSHDEALFSQRRPGRTELHQETRITN